MLPGHSHHAEARRVLDCGLEALPQDVLRAVFWDQQLVEAAYEQGQVFDEEAIYEVIIALISENGLNFSPGEGKQYSNSNYLIAALLVEELTDMAYHDYIQQSIFNPLNI